MRFIIKVYQLCLAPFFGFNCKFYPSCSQYALEAIKEYGLSKGCLKAAVRIIRCNPFSQGGYDPVVKNNKLIENKRARADKIL